MSILNLLRADGSIVVNKHLARVLGLNEAIILSELISWHMYYADRGETDEEGMFFVTIEKLEHNTTIKKDSQNRAIKKLIERNLILTKQKGLPSKRYFWINEQAITDLIIGSRSGTDSKDSQNAKPDKDAASEAQNSEKPHNGQLSQNAKPSNRKTRNPDIAKRETNNTKSINTYLIEKEEEDTTPSPTAISAALIKQDIEKTTNQYPQYQKVTEHMGALAIKEMRPILAEEELFLEHAAEVPVHPETLWRIYEAVRSEIDRSSSFPHAAELIETVFSRFKEHLLKGRINFDAAAWFNTTWVNERIAIEQATMLK